MEHYNFTIYHKSSSFDSTKNKLCLMDYTNFSKELVKKVIERGYHVCITANADQVKHIVNCVGQSPIIVVKEVERVIFTKENNSTTVRMFKFDLDIDDYDRAKGDVIINMYE
ncbi:hypothetical protein [Phthorimaea operculella granulovirus]|uniref:Uncharacterized protein n=1 Tax=Phthorimaea operculella granulovirus TaxID=192584 RepID=Q8JS23_9BBAC|nr:hypothetical protein [Phthorimaea operculella granulovirus]AAM70234.1 hypothetical protein [Phthorimaea operculella granulovirus]ANY57425.1 hypothetical protein PhopGVgp036 [Phthorimaea operculella granulovirus]QBH65871.1 hypothetical protein PhopGVgp036 [Phthorimaea operculella granulovirus]QBH66001.1 hypothetical protein PhopGVgp036 [Phthorimaea operculella granulovirus]QBH66131.1 hypothetical protein PhopGVgp036 [Phthorimaea operculella granulovirus]